MKPSPRRRLARAGFLFGAGVGLAVACARDATKPAPVGAQAEQDGGNTPADAVGVESFDTDTSPPGSVSSTPTLVDANGAPVAPALPDAGLLTKPGRLRLPATPSTSDAGARPTPEYERVKTDRSCGLEPVPAKFLYYTCCNGQPCRGDCVRFKGEKTPVCYCASLRGGCPAPHHCCMMTHCGWVDYCN